MALNAVLLVFVSVVILIVLFYQKKFRYWKNKNVYTDPPHLLFGNAFNLMRHKRSHGEEFQLLYNTFKAKHLAYGGYYAFAKPIFIPTDLNLIKNILINDFDHFTDHIIHVNEEVEPIGVNLITLKGLKWKKLRTKLTASFTIAKMKSMFPTLRDCSKDLCKAFHKQMDDTGTTNVKDLIARYTTDVIASCVFGLECNSLSDPDASFRQVGKMFFDVSKSGNALIQILAFLMPSLLSTLKIPLIDQKVKDTFTEIVKNNAEYRETNNIVRNDIFHLLIEMKNKSTQANDTEEPFTIVQMIAQCFLFFLAGFETSSTATTYCLYELAANPEIQERLRREVITTIAKHGGEITYETLADMTFMDQCINESLRKYPPIPVHTRECTKPYRIPNTDVILEKGMYVMIAVCGIHRDPEYYPDPEKYDPDRFSKENQVIRHPCAWIPFGAGPRICIAEKFGVLQIKVCLSALLRKYRFTLNGKMEHPLTFDKRSTTILSPNGEVLLDIHEIMD